jgi:hypothetical protein
MLKMEKFYRFGRNNLFTAIVVMGSIFLSSCSQEPQPSNSEIEKALITQLPAFINISKLSVEAKQNLGTKVEPLWQARLRATITVSTDTFELENEDSDENSEVTFVIPVKRSGETIEVFGKSVSELYAGTWRTTVELEGQPLETLGQPLSAFGSKKVIARGSQEEKQYLADIQTAEMRVAQQKKQMLADAPKLLVGSWRDENSLVTYNADGTKSGIYDSGGTEKGTWSIEGDIMTDVRAESNGKSIEKPTIFRYQILEITGEKFVSKSLNGGEMWHAARVK